MKWGLLVLVLLTGCIQVQDRRSQLDKLVGQSESLARRVLGPPTDITQSGDRLYLSYVDPGKLESFAGYDMFGGYGRYGTIGYRRLGFEAPITEYELRCQTTLEVQQGVVVTYALKGDHCG